MPNVDFESDIIKQTKAYRICALKALNKFSFKEEEDDDNDFVLNAFSIASTINKRYFFGHKFE
jgi:hypothetical protein